MKWHCDSDMVCGVFEMYRIKQFSLDVAEEGPLRAHFLKRVIKPDEHRNAAMLWKVSTKGENEEAEQTNLRRILALKRKGGIGGTLEPKKRKRGIKTHTRIRAPIYCLLSASSRRGGCSTW